MKTVISEKNRKPQYRKQDEVGHYDIDGVSFTGDEIVVGSENEDTSSDTTKGVQQINKKAKKKPFKEDPQKVDRQKNRDFYY